MAPDGRRRFDMAGLHTSTPRPGVATYPELLRHGPQRLVVLGAEMGGRWSTGAQACGLVRELVRLRPGAAGRLGGPGRQPLAQ